MLYTIYTKPPPSILGPILMLHTIFLVLLFSALLLISSVSAKPSSPSKSEAYECILQWVHENYLEQFNRDAPRVVTCIYKCRKPNGAFEWFERLKDSRGCKYEKTLYKATKSKNDTHTT